MTPPIRVAIVGVGNCASALIQGVHHYREQPAGPGLMTERIGRYGPGDIQFSAAFDVAETKVGLDLSSAILAEPNCTLQFHEVPYLDVTVVAGPRLDGVGRSLERKVKPVKAEESVVDHLRATETDVVVNFLPVGSAEASRYYAVAAVDAGCAFVNAIPTRIARSEDMQELFHAARLPLVGDDVKSQVGATIVHRVLAETFSRRGVELLRTYQENIGGNTDFLNMLDEERLAEKRVSKSGAVTSVANQGRGIPDDHVHIGPSGYVPWLGDKKVAFIRLEGAAFGGAPLSVELRMEVWDSPNSAGVVIDAVRYAADALDRGVGGPLLAPSAWLMKAPPEPMAEDEAWDGIHAPEHEQAVSPRGRQPE